MPACLCDGRAGPECALPAHGGNLRGSQRREGAAQGRFQGLGQPERPLRRSSRVLETLARELDTEAAGDTGAPGGAQPLEAPAPDSPHARILAAVAAIPEGAVMTCGQVADRAGLSGQGRTVADALARHPEAAGWHRVVDAEGRILTPPERRQRTMLEAEGVGFTLDRVDLQRFAPGAGA